MLYTMKDAWVPMASVAVAGAAFSMIISLAVAGITFVTKAATRRRLRRDGIPEASMPNTTASFSMSNAAPEFTMPNAAAGPRMPNDAAAQWLPIDPAAANPGDIVVFDDSTTATAVGNGQFRGTDGHIRSGGHIRPIKEILRISLGAGDG